MVLHPFSLTILFPKLTSNLVTLFFLRTYSKPVLMFSVAFSSRLLSAKWRLSSNNLVNSFFSRMELSLFKSFVFTFLLVKSIINEPSLSTYVISSNCFVYVIFLTSKASQLNSGSIYATSSLKVAFIQGSPAFVYIIPFPSLRGISLQV